LHIKQHLPSSFIENHYWELIFKHALDIGHYISLRNLTWRKIFAPRF